MRGSGRRRKHGAAEDVGGQLVLSFGLLESLLPIGGSELEQAISGPGADHAEQVSEVAVGLDSVQASAGEQRDEHGVDGSAVVAADEQPVSTTEDLAMTARLLSRRVLSFSFRGASAMDRSIRKSAPMCESATLARSGSESSAL